MPHINHISMVIEQKTESKEIPTITGRVVIDGDLYREGTVAQLLAVVRKIGGGSGFLRIYDYINADELALIEFTEENPTAKRVKFKLFPKGIVCLEAQLYTDGVGEVFCLGASVEVS